MVMFVYFEGTVGVSPRVNKYIYIFLYENHHLLPCSSALHHPVQLPHPQTTWGDRPVPHTWTYLKEMHGHHLAGSFSFFWLPLTPVVFLRPFSKSWPSLLSMFVSTLRCERAAWH